MEIKTSWEIVEQRPSKKWVSIESEVKWLNELEARIMIDYSKEELLIGIRKHIKILKGKQNEN